MSYMYGLNDDIKKYIDKKIDENKTFLKNMTFYNEDYKLISMFDSDLNANLSPQRYFSEVANRVNTLFDVAKELQLAPAFLTITLPSAFHPKSDVYNGFTPRESALFLSDIWSKFLRLMIFRHIKDDSGHNMIYIRVYEPHKSGVPHLHAMIFVPRAYISDVKVKFFEHFENYDFKSVGLKFITNFTHAKYEDSKGAIAYILKYMNKTFKNAKEDKMTNEAYYFAYHGIRRFITSQTLIPLWIYRKIKHNEDTRNLKELTRQYKDGNIYSSFDKEFITQRFLKKEKIVYDVDDIEYSTTVEERLLYQKNHFISEQFKKSNIQNEKVPHTWTKKKEYIPIFQNDKIIMYYKDGVFKRNTKHITQMSDIELYEYYLNYDVDNSDYTHYLAVRNLMISRKLLKGIIYNLSNFNINTFFGL